MKKNWKRRVLALMMVSMLASSAFVVPAFATDGSSIVVASEDGYTEVSDATALSNAITSGGKIRLTASITADVTISTGVTVVLDLNNCTLTNSSGHTITNNGTLTIIGKGTVDNVTDAKAALINQNGGTVTISEGTIFTRSLENSKTGTSPNSFYYIFNKPNSKMYINGASVPGISTYSSTIRNDGYMEINSGTVSGGLIAVKNDETGTLVVNGGQIDGKGDQAIQNWCNATINGGSMVNGGILTWAYKDRNQILAGNTVINGGSVDAVGTAIYGGLGDNPNSIPTVVITGSAKVDSVWTYTNGSSVAPANSYGTVSIVGDEVVVGSIRNSGDHNTISVTGSKVASITNSGSGLITVDKDSTVTGNISGNVQVSPLADVQGTNSSTNETKYTLVINAASESGLSWDEVVQKIKDAAKTGYTTNVSEEGTIITVTYTVNKYTVNFNGSSISVEYGQSITILSAPNDANTWRFIGWSDGTKIYYPGETYTVTGPVTFTPVYENYVYVPDYTPSTPTTTKNDGWTDLAAGSVYYKNGVKVKGWQEIDGETYYFDKKGYLQTGWLELDEGWYYLNPRTGAQQTGWQKVGNTWYYLDPRTGVMEDSGLKVIGGETYYFYSWGGMAGSWWYLDEASGSWYFFRGNGAMAKSSWIEWKGKWYYVDGTGTMVTNKWIQSGSYWYYLGSNGTMLTNTTTPDGYKVDQGGKWIR